MNKKQFGILTIFGIFLLGIGAVSAFGFGNGNMLGLNDEEKAEMESFHNAREHAIKSGDFESWKSLMETRMTEEHFEQMRERWTLKEQHRNEMQNAFENGEMPPEQGYGMHRGMMSQGQNFRGSGYEECPYMN